MPLPENAATPETALQGPGSPVTLSRRSMLRGAAGASAAGLALTTLAVSPALAASNSSADTEHVPDDVADGDPVVAHVRDVRSGEIDVYRGNTHVRVRDRALAARLARASR